MHIVLIFFLMLIGKPIVYHLFMRSTERAAEKREEAAKEMRFAIMHGLSLEAYRAQCAETRAKAARHAVTDRKARWNAAIAGRFSEL